MKTTTEIIKQCFKKAGMQFVKDDRAKYLFSLLCDEMDKKFNSVKYKSEKESRENLVINEGWNIYFGDYTIQSADNCYQYNGSKNVVVSFPYEKTRPFNTVVGAIKFVEENA